MGELSNKTKFRLTETALRIIRESTDLKEQLALSLGCSQKNIADYVIFNSSELTKFAAVLVLSAYSGMTFDKLFERNKNI